MFVKMSVRMSVNMSVKILKKMICAKNIYIFEIVLQVVVKMVNI